MILEWHATQPRRAALRGQTEAGDAAGAVGAVFQGEGAAVALGDLTAQDEANAGTAGFGGEEGDEEVGGAGETGAFVFDPNFDHVAVAEPADGDAAFGDQRGVGGVAEEVDEDLLELVGVALNRDGLSSVDLDLKAGLEADGAIDAGGDVEGLKLGAREFREAGGRATRAFVRQQSHERRS